MHPLRLFLCGMLTRRISSRVVVPHGKLQACVRHGKVRASDVVWTAGPHRGGRAGSCVHAITPVRLSWLGRLTGHIVGILSTVLNLQLRILHANHAGRDSRVRLPSLEAELEGQGPGVHRRRACVAGTPVLSSPARPRNTMHCMTPHSSPSSRPPAHLPAC